MSATGIYCGTSWYQEVFTSVPSRDRLKFTAHKLYLVDNTALYDIASSEFFLKMGWFWRERKNLVLLPQQGVSIEDIRSLTSVSLLAQPVGEKNSSVKVEYFDVNTLRLRVMLSGPKLLLWADNYHTGWHVFINGREGRVLRADYAFKGVWLPAGESRVLFRYATPWRYAGAWVVLLVFMAALLTCIFFARREGWLVGKGADDGF